MLDANALFPMMLRDTLLRAAQLDLFAPVWSPRILDEMTRNLIAKRGLSHQQVGHIKRQLKLTFPEALTRPSGALIGMMRNDIGDRHVAAAAVSGAATLIVTFNTRHFAALPPGVAAVHPDDFLLDLLHHAPSLIRLALEQQAAAFRHPPLTTLDVLTRLAASVPGFARQAEAMLRDWPAHGESLD